jgi:hypothetical protein
MRAPGPAPCPPPSRLVASPSLPLCILSTSYPTTVAGYDLCFELVERPGLGEIRRLGGEVGGDVEDEPTAEEEDVSSGLLAVLVTEGMGVGSRGE